jgi:hypothetical protein
MNIPDRIDYGEEGEALADIVAEQVDSIAGFSDDTARRIVASRVIKRLVKLGLHDEPKARVAPVEPMHDHEALAFGRSAMQYGKHAGTFIRDVPLEYLCMLTDPNEFTKNLKRYVAWRARR